jgi:hypothetical protein
MVQLAVTAHQVLVQAAGAAVVAKMERVTQAQVLEPYMAAEVFCRMAVDQLTAATGPFA